MSEQRGTIRSRTFLQARVVFNGGQSSLDCVIRDLSEGGARLTISEGITLPDVFRLHITKTDERRQVRLCWRRGSLVGVRFEPEPLATPEPDAAVAARRIRELEAEVARLRRMLEELRADPGRIVTLLDQAV